MTDTSLRRRSLLSRFAGWSHRHHWAAIVAWVLVVGALAVAAGRVGSAFEDDNTLPGSESQRVADALAVHEGGPAPDEVTVVVHRDDGLDEPAVQGLLARIAAESAVSGVSDPFATPGSVSEDGDTVMATVTLDSGASSDDVAALVDTSLDGYRVEWGGDPVREATAQGGPAEGIGLLAAIIILVPLFGSVLAAAMPLVTAIFAVGSAVSAVILASHLLTVPSYATAMMALVGLGVGIDYALLVFVRYRHEIRQGADRSSATERALDTAGRSVLFAGATVIVALLGMLTLGQAAFRSLALSVALTVLATMIASITLLPALLTLFGRRLEARIQRQWHRRTERAARRAQKRAPAAPAAGLPGAGAPAAGLPGAGLSSAAAGAAGSGAGLPGAAGPGAGLPGAAAGAAGPGAGLPGAAGPGAGLPGVGLSSAAAGAAGSGAGLPDAGLPGAAAGGGGRWRALARLIQRFPWPALVGGVLVLIVLALPAANLRLGFADAGTDPPGSTTREAYDLIAEGFGPGTNGPLLVLAPDEASAEEAAATVRSVRGVASVLPHTPVAEGVLVVPDWGPADERTADLVHRLRDSLGDAYAVGGSVPAAIDFADTVSARLPWFIAAVVGLSALMLLVVFRSVLVPVQAAVSNLLSIGAALGVMTFVYGEGNLGAQPGPIEAFLPVIVFAVVFGLSMDYEVFLVSRVHEEWRRGLSAPDAMREGLATTGGVITAAAAIMIVVFGSFVLSGDRMLGEMGLGLAAAVLVDALIVRCLVVPAVFALAGERAWWLPRWLHRLPEVRLH
ncbi:MMPL family transporter [Cryptosporangium aurantiacum]|uniref:MMPL family transporter n=1 Tax=Cryptosporangium aurantiacum TaxID=134849 RepID=UPI000933CAC4|nr:MMPL family transporter [Cryptosporangium aurantiacum]